MITRIVYMVVRISLSVIVWFLLAMPTVYGADNPPNEGDHKLVKDSFLVLQDKADTLMKYEQFEEARGVLLDARDLTRGVLAEPYAACLYQLGNIYQWTDSLDLAMENYYLFIEQTGPLQMDSLKAKVYTEMARIFTVTGNYQRAYEFHLKSIPIKESMQDQKGLRRSYYDLGSLFFYYEKNYEEALKFFREVEKIPVEGDAANRLKCVAWIAIGSTYEKLGDLRNAREYSVRAYELAKAEGYNREIGYALQNIGNNWLALEKFELALESLKNSVQYFREIPHVSGMVISLNYLGKVYLKMDDSKRAINAYSESLEITREKNLRPQEILALDGLAQAYESAGKFKTAYRYLRESKSLKDTIEDEETATDLARRRAQFDISQKEKELVEVRKEKELLEEKRKLDELINRFSVALAVIGLILVLVILQSYARQKKNNHLLAEKNEEIENQNSTLEEQNLQIENQNKKLEYANSELTQFAYVASHDLKEPLRTIASFTKLIQQRNSDQFDDFAKESFGFITGAVDRMKLLLDDLLTYSRIDRPETELDHLNMGLVLNDVISNLMGKTTETNASIEVNFEQMPEVRGIRTHFTQLFQNIISNGIKFKKEEVDPLVKIDCEEDQKYYTFSICDNGIGIPENAKNKIFEMFTRLNNKHRYTGTGIGLATCKKIVDFYRGNIWVESAEGVGSTFFIQLPKEA